MGFSDTRLGKLTGNADRDGDGKAPRARRAAGVQAHRHLRRRIRLAHRLHVFDLRDAVRRRASPNEARPSDKKKVIILGGGPNRIGQGIEFDYCCCHAAFALKEAGYETIMVNCNPETVSTDYDTSDRLYFEPLTPEDVLEIIDTERANGTLHGVIVQFGGQTPLKLAEPLEKAKVPILGTSPDMIDLAEDRERFKKLLDKLKLRQPKNGIATSPDAARAIADEIGYPVVIRPSYVLGGRAMEIVRDGAQLDRYVARLASDLDRPGELVVSKTQPAADRPLSVGRHRSGRRLPGRRQGHLHRRHHGAHRGSRHPFRRLGLRAAAAFADATRPSPSSSGRPRALALALNVGGLMNVQYAIKDGDIYVLEVNPRASRTVPFVAKVIGLPVAKIAARVMAGEKPRRASSSSPRHPKHRAVKEAVFPFARFPGVDTVLGPEMKSTGEVMGIDGSLRDRLRQEPDRRRHQPAARRAPCSSRSRTRTSRASCRR